jgi:hypothetical protein
MVCFKTRIVFSPLAFELGLQALEGLIRAMTLNLQTWQAEAVDEREYRNDSAWLIPPTY